MPRARDSPEGERNGVIYTSGTACKRFCAMGEADGKVRTGES
jgi:hypothetical protein